MGIFKKLKHAWNLWTSVDENPKKELYAPSSSSYGSGGHFDRPRHRYRSERTVLASIYTKLAVDATSVVLRHVRVDSRGQYTGDVQSGLNDCLTVEANIDQPASHFRQDIYSTLFADGCVAIVPIDTTLDPELGSFDIKTLRVGEVVDWQPDRVKVNVYNDRKGVREQITLPKKYVAIVENPMYSVMNEPNSTLQRLRQKLEYLDVVDKQSASGKLDIIIQLPYAVKSETRRIQANHRKVDLEEQLSGSQYGIAYIDATEKVTQLNRPAENNLLQQVEYLTNMLYSELGLTVDVLNNKADEATMLNYYSRTIGPLVTAVQEAMHRTFLTKTARSQGQAIRHFRDPFRFVTAKDMAEIANSFVRNEVFTPNDVRVAIGWPPSSEQKANELHNPNMPPADLNMLPKDQNGS